MHTDRRFHVHIHAYRLAKLVASKGTNSCEMSTSGNLQSKGSPKATSIYVYAIYKKVSLPAGILTEDFQ